MTANTGLIEMSSEQQDVAARYPENAMGYQLLDVRLTSGRWLRRVGCFSGQYLFTFEDVTSDDIVEIVAST